ncbi:hypothetical protein C2E20_8058 [Micractinium conductrix]|uniref:Sulfotransferase n=1 Tax=Micractinium conductrix TaxID=554055 RepID=A0A2P6V2R4_9CHLO|nr:hypothetical protein C2E20_8058 [Micractinium conductrix]|eukprot:PSC68344.1 hypothetical protein C2E20_8058 [Micractinium conductrix]
MGAAAAAPPAVGKGVQRQRAAAATGTGIAADEAGASAAAAEEQGDGTLLLGQRPCIECNIFLNHTYKYIFIRHAKVGSTTTVAAFKDCKAHPEQPGCMLWGLGSMRQIGDEEALANWRDYFVFTVSRDPWERAVSMYMFLTSWVMADPPDCRTLVDWDRFCGDPLSLARMCARRPECCLSKSGAEQMARHVLDQASCMAPGVGLAVDFVARQEHLDEDLQEVFAAVNVRRDPGVPPLEPPPRVAQALKRKECPGGESALLAEHQPVELKGVINWTGLQAREQYCTTAEYYSGRHAHCVESIGRFFAADVALLGGGRPA